MIAVIRIFMIVPIIHILVFSLFGQPDTIITAYGDGYNTTGVFSRLHNVGFYGSTNFANFVADTGEVGFWAFHNNIGFLAQYNPSYGFSSTNNNTGFRASNNTIGFSCSSNSGNGYNAFNNELDGFHCSSSGRYAGYFRNSFSSDFPAVFIGNARDDSLDMMLEENGRIAADEHIYLYVDADDDEPWGKVFFVASDGSNLAVFSESGNTDINTSLDVTGGDLNVTAGNVCANNVSCGSDLRFKKNIHTIEKALSKVLKLRGVAYQWDLDQWPGRFSGRNQIGFIAQELEEVLPELVYTDNEGYRSVDYSKMTAVLVEAVKELELKNRNLEKTVNELCQQIEQFSERD